MEPWEQALKEEVLKGAQQKFEERKKEIKAKFKGERYNQALAQETLLAKEAAEAKIRFSPLLSKYEQSNIGKAIDDTRRIEEALCALNIIEC